MEHAASHSAGRDDHRNRPGRGRDLHDVRRDYGDLPFSRADLAPDPIVQFARWYEDARSSDIVEPNAMTIATTDADGAPDARIVLLKELRPEGFVFFTNYASAKGAQLDATPQAALVFHWDRLERQVRVRGAVERIPPAESDVYFAARPVRSRIAAVASPQSRPVSDRGALETAFAETTQAFDGADDVPRPDAWGGYLVRPRAIEFWQGRRSRLHDRLRYEREADGWRVARLAP